MCLADPEHVESGEETGNSYTLELPISVEFHCKWKWKVGIQVFTSLTPEALSASTSATLSAIAGEMTRQFTQQYYDASRSSWSPSVQGRVLSAESERIRYMLQALILDCNGSPRSNLRHHEPLN